MTLLEVDMEMYQSVLIPPLSWIDPTLPLTEVTVRKVARISEILTSHFVTFSMNRNEGVNVIRLDSN